MDCNQKSSEAQEQDVFTQMNWTFIQAAFVDDSWIVIEKNRE